MKPSTTKKRVKAWAVVDTSRRLYPKKDYIDINYQGVSLAIYISKRAGKEYHRDFNGKMVVPCEITFTLPTKKKLTAKK